MSEVEKIQGIIRGCLKSDQQAQKALHDLCADKVMSTCKRYSNQQEELREMYQESFLRIFKYLHSFDIQKGDLLGWVYSLTRNCVFQFLSERKLYVESLEDQSIDFVDGNAIAEDHFSEKEILDLISQMPEGYRTILNLFVFEELSHQEISKLLGISESTSRSQLTRARNFLQNKLKQLHTVKYEKISI